MKLGTPSWQIKSFEIIYKYFEESEGAMKRTRVSMDFFSQGKLAFNQVRSKSAFKLGIICMGVFLLFTVIGPNLDWIKSPLTSKVNGKAIDATTNEPIRNMQILISHEIFYSYIPGNGYVDYKNSIVVNTDTEGKFTADRIIKPLSFSLFGLYNREYYGSYIMTLNNQYRYVSKKIDINGKVYFVAHKISNQDEINANVKILEMIEADNYPRNIKEIVIRRKYEAENISKTMTIK